MFSFDTEEEAREVLAKFREEEILQSGKHTVKGLFQGVSIP
jgi:hypothetical protein